MISKSQSISVRLSEEDYAYLMAIHQNNAITQSDKVRELIAMARESVGTESFARAFMSASEVTSPIRARFHEHPALRSNLLDATLDFLTESAALMQSLHLPEDAARLELGIAAAASDFTRRFLPLVLQASGGMTLNDGEQFIHREDLLADIRRLSATQSEEIQND